MINDIVLELLRKCEGSLFWDVRWTVVVWGFERDSSESIEIAREESDNPEIAIAEAFKKWRIYYEYDKEDVK